MWEELPEKAVPYGRIGIPCLLHMFLSDSSTILPAFAQ
jgi:hypothetical protein